MAKWSFDGVALDSLKRPVNVGDMVVVNSEDMNIKGITLKVARLLGEDTIEIDFEENSSLAEQYGEGVVFFSEEITVVPDIDTKETV